MRRGPRWADNLPGISNSLNWLSENTFGAAKDLRDGVDVLAGWYRAFLDRLPYRRQDGRAARALPRGRAASAFEKWEAFKRGSADDEDAARDDAAAVGGVASMRAHERAVEAFWTRTSNEAREALEEGERRKAPNRPGLVALEKKFVMTEGQTRALVADTMGLALALRRAAAAAPAAGSLASDSDNGGASQWLADPAEMDAAAEEAQDRRAELLSGWGGGGNSMALTGGGYGNITPAEAAEAPEAASAAPGEIARRIKDLSGLLLCTPGEAIAVAHRFPAILETPRSVLAARMASLKELLPSADAAVICAPSLARCWRATAPRSCARAAVRRDDQAGVTGRLRGQARGDGAAHAVRGHRRRTRRAPRALAGGGVPRERSREPFFR